MFIYMKSLSDEVYILTYMFTYMPHYLYITAYTIPLLEAIESEKVIEAILHYKVT